MMEIVKVKKHCFDFAFQKALKAIEKGQVVVGPTDTVYGLLADATNPRAVKKVFQIKQRDKIKPLPVFVKDISMARTLAEINAEQEQFLGNVWPGKVIVVLTKKKKRKVPPGLELAGKIALRIPKYELMNLLLEKLNRPLTGTSANISGAPSCSSAAEVLHQFDGRLHQPSLVLDAGQLRTSKPSMIIDITSEPYKVLRK